MSHSNLENRIIKLEKSLPGFSQDLRFALQYITPDAKSSLTKSRIVMEKLLVQLYISEMGHEPRRALLGDLLVDNQFTRRFERRIVSRMNSIRDGGNLGAHGEMVEPSDAIRVLDDLCEVLEWYLRRKPGSDPVKFPSRVIEPKEVDQARVPEPDQARAFIMSWQLLTILSRDAVNPSAVLRSASVYAEQLGLPPSSPINVSNPEAVVHLLKSFKEQIAARRPLLSPYFEAGMHLPLDAARSNGRGIAARLMLLQVPASLKTDRTDALNWLNEILECFKSALA